MRFHTLDEWLVWQTSLHGCAVDLGLERVGEVARRLDLLTPTHTVITVAGTNGKGSTVAMLEAILGKAGYRVGAYTSPHLLRYNERIRLEGSNVSDQMLCEAFAVIDQARGEITLSYFEFSTLAAMLIFAEQHVDVAVLEVGLGGRLDAVNLQSADVCIISSIGLDHTEWLGPDRESIGREKAGVMRSGRPAVCGDTEPPASLESHARSLGAPFYTINRDFHPHGHDGRWDFRSDLANHDDLPLPFLFGHHQLRNASCVLMAFALLRERLPLSRAAIEQGLLAATVPGRFQRVSGDVELILDVAHNPHGVQTLVENLERLPVKATHCVFAALDDKDVSGMAALLSPQMSAWYISQARSPRGLPVDAITSRVQAWSQAPLSGHPSISDAYRAARARARPGERIVVCGSFYTVAEVLSLVL